MSTKSPFDLYVNNQRKTQAKGYVTTTKQEKQIIEKDWFFQRAATETPYESMDAVSAMIHGIDRGVRQNTSESQWNTMLDNFGKYPDDLGVLNA